MKKKAFFLAAGSFALAGCSLFTSSGVHPEHLWGYNVDAPPYKVECVSTPKGVCFDPSGQAISAGLVDRLTDEVEACVGKTIDRGSFRVKIANDWHLSCDGAQQVLPAAGAGDLGCEAKGLTPTAACPCLWRAYLQGDGVIVATPSMYLFKDALTRFVTGSRNPWADPKLVACVQPTTAPLSNGSGP